MFCKFFLVWMIAHGLWNLLVYHIAQISYLPKCEMPLFNSYVWDKLRPSNGCFVQNMAKKLKVFFKVFKNPTIPRFNFVLISTMKNIPNRLLMECF